MKDYINRVSKAWIITVSLETFLRSRALAFKSNPFTKVLFFPLNAFHLDAC